MDVKHFIASGILELYVAGVLSEEENFEIYRYALEYPEIKLEIETIEASILKLSKAAYNGTTDFAKIENRLTLEDGKVMRLPRENIGWKAYSGWAAALLFAAGTLWFYVKNDQLKSEIKTVNEENVVMEQQILEARNTTANSQELLNIVRSSAITVVPLGGQEVAPTAYAKAYWNKEEKKVFIDALGLPEPPDGMVYQVWSLKLDPLAPTSLGLLEDFSTDENKVFGLLNPHESEGFGITLEPAGGSKSPTLEQLYTLGAV
ncbi:MAG: anti-sigma factor [Saonia sp.]